MLAILIAAVVPAPAFGVPIEPTVHVFECRKAYFDIELRNADRSATVKAILVPCLGCNVPVNIPVLYFEDVILVQSTCADSYSLLWSDIFRRGLTGIPLEKLKWLTGRCVLRGAGTSNAELKILRRNISAISHGQRNADNLFVPKIESRSVDFTKINISPITGMGNLVCFFERLVGAIQCMPLENSNYDKTKRLLMPLSQVIQDLVASA